LSVAVERAVAPASGQVASGQAADTGFGVYVHWPFCLAKCPYCDFNSHVRERLDPAAWARNITRELDHFASETSGRPVTSIYFGGGTPSLMDLFLGRNDHRSHRRRWGLAGDAEITLEANPTSVEAAKLAGFRSAGRTGFPWGFRLLTTRTWLSSGAVTRPPRRAPRWPWRAGCSIVSRSI